VNLPDALRYATVLCVVSGVVHLLVPGRLLAAAAWGYDRVLAVEFTPKSGARTRVRLVGVAVLAVGVVADRARRTVERVRARRRI
jgi:hypothetical protein